jgi:hypothetical protein
LLKSISIIPSPVSQKEEPAARIASAGMISKIALNLLARDLRRHVRRVMMMAQ